MVPQLCDTWKITKFIQSGGFGRGWEGEHLVTKKKVFIKTFRSFSDRESKRVYGAEQQRKMKQNQEDSVRKEVEVLLHPMFRKAAAHSSGTQRPGASSPPHQPDTHRALLRYAAPGCLPASPPHALPAWM